MMDLLCLICKRTDILEMNFKLIDDEIAEFSGRPLKLVLRHILRCTKVELDIEETSCLCSKCQSFLNEYDEHVVKQMNLQKQFKAIFDDDANKHDAKRLLLKTFEAEPTRMQQLRDQAVEQQDDEVTEVLQSDEVELMADEDIKVESDLSIDDDGDDENIDMLEADDGEEDSENRPNHYLCKYCANWFEDADDLKQHILDFHTKKPSVCHICNISVKDEEHLDLHMNLHDGKTETECRYCDKTFASKSSVIRHMAKHWDKKKYQCEKCGLRFSETPRLYNHKLLHEAEENPLICHICNQLCKTRRTYKRHMNTHREDRPRYPCHICGKTFSEKFTLKPHLRTHAEYVEESHTNKKISESETEAAAAIIVETTEPSKETYICVICGGLFYNCMVFHKHMKQEHDITH